MPWVKVDDEFLDNHKVLIAGPLPAYLYLAGLIWTNHARKDGWIPDYQLRRLVDWNGISAPHPDTGEVVPVDPAALAKKLVDVGLWKRVNDGFEIHDYGKYQPQSDEAFAKRKEISAKRSAAGKKGAAKRWEKANDGNGIASEQQSGGNTDSPEARSPSPEVQQPSVSTSSLTASSTAVVAREESDEEARSHMDELRESLEAAATDTQKAKAA